MILLYIVRLGTHLSVEYNIDRNRLLVISVRKNTVKRTYFLIWHNGVPRPPTFSSAERNFRRRVILSSAEENLGLEKDDVSYLKQNPTTNGDKSGSGRMEEEKGRGMENCWGVKGLRSIKEVENGNESFVPTAHVSYRALLQEVVRRDLSLSNAHYDLIIVK